MDFQAIIRDWSVSPNSDMQFNNVTNFSGVPIASPLSQSSMDSGYSAITEQSSTSPPSQQIGLMTHQTTNITGNHLAPTFREYNDLDTFQTMTQTQGFYSPRAPATIEFAPFLSPSMATVPTSSHFTTKPAVNTESLPPYLEIVEQPSEKPFRFRYSSEMHGTHGSLMGAKTERSKRTYPTVALRNFNFVSKALIRCTLYQVHDEGSSKRSPHSHKLVKRRNDVDKSDPHDIEVSNESEFTAIFDGMGIIHTAKKHIREELCKKIRGEREFEENRVLSPEEILAIQRDAENQSKEMNLNQVCLCFQAYIKHEADNLWVKICNPIYSNVINNMKSALTGELRITRMSTYTSPCSGNQEVFMFVEKVCKNNIKVKFFEHFDDGAGPDYWEDFGVFNESDVHHQYGIVFRTPPYRKASIESAVEVKIQLYRPKDFVTSEPLTFKYKPNVAANNKRRRTDSIEFIPTVVGTHESKSQETTSGPFGGMQQTQENQNSFSNKFYRGNNNNNQRSIVDEDSLFPSDSLPSYFGTFSAISDLSLSPSDLKGFLNCTSEEFCRLLDIEMGGDQKLQIDGVCSNRVELTSAPHASPEITCSGLDKLKLLIKLFKNNFDDKRLQEMMTILIKSQDEFGENILLECIQHGTDEEVKDLVLILVKYKLLDVLKSTNDLDQNCLHLCAIAGYSSLLKIFLSFEVDVNQADVFGHTPLHKAVILKSVELIEELIDSTDIKLNMLDDNALSPLHLAVRADSLPIVKLLINAGCDVVQNSPPTGNSALHMAVSVKQVNIEMVAYLITCDKQLLYQENNSGVNALQLATISGKPENVIHLLATEYEESYTKYGGSEDESDSGSDNEDGEPVFDDQGLKLLCEILDANDNWKGVLILMELESKVAELESHQSPTRSLFKYFEEKNTKLEQIVMVLDMLDLKRAISVIDEMTARKFDK